MRDKNKINLIRTYKHCIEVPQGFKLHDRSHSTADEVAISVKDEDGNDVDVWKDRVWHGDYEFNDRQDYWWFDLKRGYEFLQPLIDEIFVKLEQAKKDIAEAKSRRDERIKNEIKEAEQKKIESLKTLYVKPKEITSVDKEVCPTAVYRESTRDDLE